MNLFELKRWSCVEPGYSANAETRPSDGMIELSLTKYEPEGWTKTAIVATILEAEIWLAANK